MAISGIDNFMSDIIKVKMLEIDFLKKEKKYKIFFFLQSIGHWKKKKRLFMIYFIINVELFKFNNKLSDIKYSFDYFWNNYVYYFTNFIMFDYLSIYFC